MNWEFPYVQAGLEDAEEPDIKLPTSIRSLKKQESSKKNLLLLLWLDWRLWLCRLQQTMENPSKDGNTKPPNLPPWEICMQAKKQQLEPNMEQWTGSKLGKEYTKAVYCDPASLAYT